RRMARHRWCSPLAVTAPTPGRSWTATGRCAWSSHESTGPTTGRRAWRTRRGAKSRVHRSDYRPAVMEADALTTFYRLYGDADGNRTVDAADQAAFDAAFGQTDALSLATFDFNRDGQINVTDRTQFNRRFGRTI